MKKIFILLTILLPTALLGQKLVPDPFTIAGHVSNLNTPAKAYLLYTIGANNVIDSAVITNGEFSFGGQILSPESAYMVIDHQGVGVSKLLASPRSSVAPIQLDVLNFYLDGSI